MNTGERQATDREALAREGVSGATLDALATYTANAFDVERFEPSRMPLPDAPHLEAWEAYQRDAAGEGVIPALSRRLVQLRFPIAHGISQSDA